MVEVDIRMTKDSVPVLLHSERLEHTTTGNGLLADHTWEEVQRLDAGIWKGPEFTGERVPSLENVLDMTRNRVPLNLDFQAADAVAPSVALVRDAGMTSDIVVSGCQVECFEIMAEATAELSTLFNPDRVPGGIGSDAARSVVRRAIEQASKLGAVGINLRNGLVDPDVVVSAQTAGLGVWVFTVDDEKRFAELLAMGVKSVTTNWPARMVALAGHRSSSETGASAE
jgi:glycerophosphoryl diester phosphodiesterase